MRNRQIFFRIVFRARSTALLFAVLGLLFAAVCAKAQTRSINSTKAHYEDFIPEGDTILDIARGDLNKDGNEDIVLALRDSDEDENTDYEENDSIKSNPRLLLVLLKTDSGYVCVSRSEDAILCKGCGGIFGDPFDGITIKKGVLTLSQYGGSAWRWSYKDKFQYRNGDMYLIGTTKWTYWNVKYCKKLDDFADAEHEDVNLITGDRVVKQISEDCKLVENYKDKIKTHPLKRLSEFKLPMDEEDKE